MANLKKIFKVIVLTGSRAEYGLLRPLIKKIEIEKNFKNFLICTGMHLSPEFGSTIFEIEKDNFKIYDKLEILLSSNTKAGMTKATGLAFLSYADSFSKINPDILICLGDRFEIFAGAYAAALMNIPVAHIQGGELTYGAIDDTLRHAITKASSIHFPTTQEYKKRIIQLGESPSRVFNVGALGVERVKKIKKVPLSLISEKLGINIENGFFLLTIHSATFSKDKPDSIIKETLKALENFNSIPVIMSYANTDSGGHEINKIKEDFCQKKPHMRVIKKTLGNELYINCMRYASAVIGNTSSGVIEAPMIGVPTVNIGNRQEGRIMGKSIFQAKANKKSIIVAIDKALNFERKINNKHSFGKGNTSQMILHYIKYYLNKKNIQNKKFYDIKTKI